MRSLFILAVIVIINIEGNCQPQGTDSLIQLLEKTSADTNRVNLLIGIANKLYFYQPDISLDYSTKALLLSRKLEYKKGILLALRLAGESSRLTGDYPGALKLQFEALELHRKLKDSDGEVRSLAFIGIIYMGLKEYREAVSYLLQSISLRKNLHNTPDAVFALTNTGIAYDFLKIPDSALYYLQLANERNRELNHPQLKSLIYRNIGQVYVNIGKKDSALHYYFIALNNSVSSNESINLGMIQRQIAEVYESMGKYDLAVYFARNAFSEAQRTSQKSSLLESSSLLVRIYRARQKLDSAFLYEDIAAAMKDSLYGTEKLKRLQLVMLDQQKKQQEAQQEQERYKTKIKIIALSTAGGIFLIIMFILYRNNRLKQKINRVLEKTLSDLRSTQAQLIQSEKMASLGELTAGIAHEIQNPLNFVNNFSEVNDELLKELKTEAEKGNLEEVKAIATDIAFNSEKINQHGKRADSIVKGMLQHSRSSSGKKEPTDINALADEYLRLAYHGMRAKDKSFNATTKTEFDNSIGKVNVVPQEIGRVILNLINNAFYAVNEKAKQNIPGYEPLVIVKTSLNPPPAGGGRGAIEIKVKDNGNGIPQKNLDKIFQPFFTTKSTGQGTGLGLSLAYDIITKGHGGKLKVDTKEGEGTVFTIVLP